MSAFYGLDFLSNVGRPVLRREVRERGVYQQNRSVYVIFIPRSHRRPQPHVTRNQV